MKQMYFIPVTIFLFSILGCGGFGDVGLEPTADPMLFRGEWNSDSLYNFNNVVRYQNAVYVSWDETSVNIAQQPDTHPAVWGILIADGQQGPAGDSGGDGQKGSKGDPGDDGPQGLKGDDGDAGIDGATWHSGSEAPPPSYLGKNGDFYFSTVTSTIYEKRSGFWAFITVLEGPQGIQGVAGKDGSNGVDGAQGTAGADGATWYTGAGAPGAATGSNGDYYLDNTTNHVYLKSSGLWIYITNLTGGTGPSGADGRDGLGIGTIMGQSCLTGEVIVGFQADGSLICNPDFCLDVDKNGVCDP